MLIATKLALTTTIAFAVGAATFLIVSNDIGRDIAMLGLLGFGLALIYGLKKNRGRVEVAAGLGLIAAGTYVASNAWLATNDFQILTVKTLIEFLFALGFFTAGYVTVLMKVSDLVDRRCLAPAS